MSKVHLYKTYIHVLKDRFLCTCTCTLHSSYPATINYSWFIISKQLLTNMLVLDLHTMHIIWTHTNILQSRGRNVCWCPGTKSCYMWPHVQLLPYLHDQMPWLLFISSRNFVWCLLERAMIRERHLLNSVVSVKSFVNVRAFPASWSALAFLQSGTYQHSTSNLFPRFFVPMTSHIDHPHDAPE